MIDDNDYTFVQAVEERPGRYILVIPVQVFIYNILCTRPWTSPSYLQNDVFQC